MRQYIYIHQVFHYIFILPIHKIQNKLNVFIKFIPIKWQLILMNDGSFTQNLYYINNIPIDIQICQKKNYEPNTSYRNIRCIWLKNCLYTKLIFARSLWKFSNLNLLNNHILREKPVGLSLIKTKLDIYKEFHEIYYGYCQLLEKKLNIYQPIWGRKYTVYYYSNSYATIQEFFSPDIISFF